MAVSGVNQAGCSITLKCSHSYAQLLLPAAAAAVIVNAATHTPAGKGGLAGMVLEPCGRPATIAAGRTDRKRGRGTT